MLGKRKKEKLHYDDPLTVESLRALDQERRTVEERISEINFQETDSFHAYTLGVKSSGEHGLDAEALEMERQRLQEKRAEYDDRIARVSFGIGRAVSGDLD